MVAIVYCWRFPKELELCITWNFVVVLRCFHTSTELKNKKKLLHSNIRLVLAFISFGRDRTAAEIFCVLMNLPSPPEKLRTYTEMLFNSTKFACEKSIRKCVEEAPRIDRNRDITVALNG
ncbi:hypothetical protein TNCV_3157021 [Trichonephila clavipes]|nr:hypothetical protein TNCV_3157021 [Trichonephila clavipes]